MTLNGSVVAVTGAARGIGYEIARALRDAGARVAISDIDKSELKNAAGRLGVEHWSQLDVTDADGFRDFLADVEQEVGPLDALVNNAGIMPAGPLLDQDDTVTRRIVEINGLGMIFGTKQALRLMVPRGRGHIINMCSTMGEAPVPGLATYNASKAAAIMFSDAARLEFRESGVKLSVILPGAVNTELASGIKGPKGIPNVEPGQVAQAVVTTLTRGESRPRVYVPAVFGVLLHTGRMLPRNVAEALNRRLGAESAVLENSDLVTRAAYDDRIRRS
jgi:NAD(P)-dependent dehydrogenase (short-subunit alcohol dehydrogenase family)